MPRATEYDISVAVLKIAASRPDGLCTFPRARREIPNHVPLNLNDKALSNTRNGEPMWHQLVRNIKSHHNTDGNFIADGLLEHVSRRGYRITKAGRKFLEQNRL